MIRVLTIPLPAGLLERADARATRLGMDRTQDLHHLIRQDLAREQASPPAFQSEDLAGSFTLNGRPTNNPRVRRQWQHRAAIDAQANR